MKMERSYLLPGLNTLDSVGLCFALNNVGLFRHGAFQTQKQVCLLTEFTV